MPLTVNLVLDLNDRGALYHCATSIQKHIQNVDISLVDYRDSIKSTADVTHYFTWYTHRDSNVIADDAQTLVTIHHISKQYSHVSKLIRQNIAIVNMSTEWQRLLSSMGANDDYNAVVPHGVDLEFWTPGVADEVPLPFTVGVVGRVYQDGRKGERLIPQIFKQLAGCGIRVVFVGPGWERVTARLRGMSVEATHFIDLDIEDLRSLVRTFSVFLCTSDVEGGPLPLLEAMATGVTPVSTPVGIARDLLPGRQVGYIYPKGNAYVAATIIKKLKNGDFAPVDKDKLWQSASLYSWTNTAKGYAEVYRAISTGKALPSDPCHFHSAINPRKLSCLEWLCLKSNPYPTDIWTQPLIWRSLNKLNRSIPPARKCI